jgi:hypothetical protein
VRRFRKLEFSGITVSHQVFVKPKIERLRISSHLKQRNDAFPCGTLLIEK